MSDFEQWAENDDYAMNLSLERDEDGRYCDIHIENMLRGWNAAIASMQGEAVAYCGEDHLGNLCNFTTDKPISGWHKLLFTYPPSAESKIAEQEARIKELEAENAKLKMAIEYDNADDDADWEPPHPIFQLAQERDNFMFRVKELEQQLEVARKDAERWQAICNLWFSCSELKLIQKEDGGYSICEMEFVDNLLVSDFCGDTPEHTIDAAIRQIGGAE